MTYIIIGIVMVVLAVYIFIKSEDRPRGTHSSRSYSSSSSSSTPVVDDDDDPLRIKRG
jgi:hypothetical protein